MFARVLNGVGRVLIGAGTLMILFVAYQLWGTGLHHARAQDDLAREFDELLAVHSDVVNTGTTVTTTTTPTSTPTSTLPDPTTTAPTTPTLPNYATPVPIEPGAPIARIQIPRINLNEYVVEGVTVTDLRKAPGHYRNTPQPGYLGNTAIAGHRTTYGAPFGDIDQLDPGDEIIVTTFQGTFTYQVASTTDDPTSGHLIVEPTDVWVLDDFGDNRLTLTACHPKYSAAQRIVVVAKLVGSPLIVDPSGGSGSAAVDVAPPSVPLVSEDLDTESNAVDDSQTVSESADPAPADVDQFALGDPSLDEGLGGDPSAKGPAIAWGTLFFILLGATWFLSKRWKRLPAYAIGAIPLVLLMFNWFEQLDRWMPAR